MSESAPIPDEEPPSFAVTSKARNRVLDLRADEENPDTLALWPNGVVVGEGDHIHAPELGTPQNVDVADILVFVINASRGMDM